MSPRLGDARLDVRPVGTELAAPVTQVASEANYSRHMNLLDKLEVGTASVRNNFESRLSAGFHTSDIGQAARDVCALWESTLVMSGYAWTGSTYLYNQVQDLSSLGWSAAEDLHMLRRTNNDAKHGSPITVSPEEVLDALGRVEKSIPELIQLVPGLQQDSNEPRLRRTVCAIYDWFAQGETEFALFEAVPSDTWQTCRLIDEFQVNVGDEAAIFSELEKLSGWRYSPPEFVSFESSLRESDRELWKVAVFTAQYEDVIGIIARFQHNRNLLGGLHRDDSKANVLATLCIVGSHRFKQNVALTISGLLADGSSYGMVGRRGDLENLAGAVVKFYSEISTDYRSTLCVDRARRATYDEELVKNPAAVDEENGLILSRSGVLFVRTP